MSKFEFQDIIKPDIVKSAIDFLHRKRFRKPQNSLLIVFGNNLRDIVSYKLYNLKTSAPFRKRKPEVYA